MNVNENIVKFGKFVKDFRFFREKYMKRLPLLCIVLAFLIPGCGKKKQKTQKPMTKEQPSLVKSKKTKKLASGIPVYKDGQDLLDDEDVSNFAFVDDENTSDIQSKNAAKSMTTKKVAPKVASIVDTQIGKEGDDAAFIDDESVQTLAQNEAEGISADDESAGDYDFKTVHFDLNRNEIRDDQRPLVEEDCSVAQKAVTEGKKVVVSGHCCQLGSHSYNMALSERRAEVMKDEIVKHGVPQENIKVVGLGSEMPLVWSEKKDRAALVKDLSPNRRTEISVN